MPESLAKQVRKELSKRFITPQDRLQEAIVEIARDIAIIESNPTDWGWWVIFLLEMMEGEAVKKRKGDEFKEFLNYLRRDLQSF